MKFTYIQSFVLIFSNILICLYFGISSHIYNKKQKIKHDKFMEEFKKIKEERKK